MKQSVSLPGRVVFGLSAAAFFLALSPLGGRWLAAFGGLGLVCGMAVALWGAGPWRPERPLLRAVLLLSALPVCWSLGACFYNTCLTSAQVQSLAAALGLPREGLLAGLSCLLAAAACPFVYWLLSRAAGACARFCALLDWSLLIRELRPASWRSFFAGVLSVLCALLLAAALGTALLSGLFRPLTPEAAARLEKNALASARIFQREGLYPDLFPWCESRLDNFTDATMILEAADLTRAAPLRRAMLVYRGAFPQDGYVDPCETMVRHYLQDEAYTGIQTYPRYWHGYLLLLRPLLFWMDYGAIRALNGAVQGLLCGGVLLLLWRRGLGRFVPAYLASMLLLMPRVTAYSLQYSACCYLFTLGTLLLLALGPRVGRARVCGGVFLALGIATAFFDFLTYPIAVFGVPAVFYLCLRSGDAPELRLAGLVRGGVLWGAGYAGMWSLKWVFASLLTGENVLQNAFAAVTNRLSNFNLDKTMRFSRIQVERTNLLSFFRTPAALLAAALVLWYVFRLLQRKGNPLEEKALFLTAMPYALVGVLPVVWRAVTVNHAGIHYWFTGKGCVVTALACMCGLSACCHRASQGAKQ